MYLAVSRFAHIILNHIADLKKKYFTEYFAAIKMLTAMIKVTNRDVKVLIVPTMSFDAAIPIAFHHHLFAVNSPIFIPQMTSWS